MRQASPEVVTFFLLFLSTQVEDELMKERERAMKEQEVRLAAMLAELQMSKAKEVSTLI